MRDARCPIVAVLAVPPTVIFACVVAVTLAEWSGSTLFAGMVPANLAEAAAMARADEVARRLRAGEDPLLVYDVRPEIISSAVRRVTPAEAAMWSRQVAMIHLLDRGGAIRESDRHELACLALDLDLEDVVAYLVPEGEPSCTPGQARDRVLARTLEQSR